MSLANENISMDFILEMKEAFQLFDKVSERMRISWDLYI
jgi:Ca2+-binding EF-hand superfamily protein